MKRSVIIAMTLLCSAVAVRGEAAEHRLRVVATLPTFADLVQTIGGDRVEVAAVASPQFNPHFIEPKPSDVLRVKRADLFVHAGLDLELWRGPLLDAAGNTNVMPGQPGEVDLSQGIPLLEVPGRAVSRSEGDIHIYGNPHYWMDPENGRRMARTIARKLSERDPDHAAAYQARLAAFEQRLDEKLRQWRAQLAAVTTQEAIAYHNEWPYFAVFAGIRVTTFLEPKPGIPPTPQHLRQLEQYIPAHHVAVIIQTTFYPREAADALARKTGARVALLCQNVHERPEVTDYLALFEYDINQLLAAWRGGAHA